MKNNSFILLLLLLIGNSSFAQTTIRFKEANFTITGQTGGKIKNVYQEASTLECFWEINNETRTIHLTTVEIIDTEHPDNNANIQKESIAIVDLDQNLLPDEPLEEYTLSVVPYYSVTISSENSQFKVKNSYCYVSSETNEFKEGKPGFSFTVKFETKELAEQFLTILKDELLN